MLGLQEQLIALLQIIAIDVVLAGDNAIIVGLAASRVAPEMRARVIYWGIAGAVVLRILFALITTQLLAIEQYHLGLNYLEDYKKAVAAVTPADVRAAAVKHLHPDRMVLVVAGAVDAQGKPLPKKP